MWDERVNTVIDEVARQMTEGPAAGRADFRRRVLARIEAGDAPRSAWRAAWMLSPLAVAAAMVIAIVVARGLQPHDRPPETPTTVRLKPDTTGNTGRLEPETTGNTARLKPDATGDTVLLKADTIGVPVKQDSTGNTRGRRPGTTSIEALAAPPLDVVPLAVGALASDPIQIERLDAIALINVAPLDITDAQRR